MGTTQAESFAEIVRGGSMSLETAIIYHLQSNHFPPVPPPFTAIALEAIELAKQGKYDEYQKYPNGIRRQVRDTIEGLHLEPFIEENEDDEESRGIWEVQQEAADARREEMEDR